MANIGNEPVLKVEDIIHDVLNVLKLLDLNVPRCMDGDNVNTDRSHVCSPFGASEGLHGLDLTVFLECNRQFKMSSILKERAVCFSQNSVTDFAKRYTRIRARSGRNSSIIKLFIQPTHFY